LTRYQLNNLRARQYSNHGVSYKEWYESNASIFFSENINAITMTFTWIIHTSFAIMRLFFHKTPIITEPDISNIIIKNATLKTLTTRAKLDTFHGNLVYRIC
jgi:hypothetical protein